VQGYRFFCNKLWNAAKFSLSHLSPDFRPVAVSDLFSSCPIGESLSSQTLNLLSKCGLGNIKSAAQLDDYFADHSYIRGFIFSDVDPQVVSSLPSAPAQYINLNRWIRHAKSFANKVGKQQNGQKEGSDKQVYFWMTVPADFYVA